MKKTLVLTTTYPTFLPGDGTPPFVHELTKRIATLGNEIVVLTPRRPGTKMYEVQEGVTIIRYAYFFRQSREQLANGAILPNIKKNRRLYLQIPFLCFGCLYALHSVVKKYSIQIIHAHWIFINGFIAAVYKRLCKRSIQLVITSHGSDLHSLTGGVIDLIKRRSLNQADTITVVSSFLQKKLDELMGQHMSVKILPMGVDEQYFHPNKRDPGLREKYMVTGRLFLFVGRLAEEKGIIDLIQAMSEVIQQEPDCTLLIVGHGPLEFVLKEMVANLNLASSVRFVGAVPNHMLPHYYATADVCVIPSYKEGSPVVLIEALFSGAQCIARDIEQIQEVHKNGGNVVLFGTQSDLVASLLITQKQPNTDMQLLMKTYSRRTISLSFHEILCTI